MADSEDPQLRVFAACARLRREKEADYQHKVARHFYFPFGMLSYAQMIWVKALRMVSLVEKQQVVNESVDDTLIDLINYASFALEERYGKVSKPAGERP